jgi:hypothetical protein
MVDRTLVIERSWRRRELTQATPTPPRARPSSAPRPRRVLGRRRVHRRRAPRHQAVLLDASNAITVTRAAAPALPPRPLRAPPPLVVGLASVSASSFPPVRAATRPPLRPPSSSTSPAARDGDTLHGDGARGLVVPHDALALVRSAAVTEAERVTQKNRSGSHPATLTKLSAEPYPKPGSGVVTQEFFYPNLLRRTRLNKPRIEKLAIHLIGVTYRTGTSV